MADEKKPDAKGPPAKPEGVDPFVEIVSLALGLLFLVYILNGLIASVTSSRLFSEGLRGFTAERIVARHTRPISSLLNPIGVEVISLNETNVYDSPAGRKIGSQKFQARGKILQGPVQVEGHTYYYVDYYEGKDGWVKQEDIGYMEKELNLLERIIIGILGATWYFKVLAVVFCLVCVYFVFYLFKKIKALRDNERSLLYPENPTLSGAINSKWEHVLHCSDSLNESDWRLAILESDIMLSDILDKLGLPGETMGDKLKAVEKSDFTTLDNAWEAHKIRNQIAHEGTSFMLSQHETKRVVALYRTVFEEFQII